MAARKKRRKTTRRKAPRRRKPIRKTFRKVKLDTAIERLSGLATPAEITAAAKRFHKRFIRERARVKTNY